jgi:P2-related tail formation protein
MWMKMTINILEGFIPTALGTAVTATGYALKQKRGSIKAKLLSMRGFLISLLVSETYRTSTDSYPPTFASLYNTSLEVGVLLLVNEGLLRIDAKINQTNPYPSNHFHHPLNIFP